uniref:NADH-ubiquinone oxidoreductase chain 6 n=1 Tax=Teliapsocus conterminus TaxID=1407779 RepID=A0A8K2AU20_9NEOP|nr:NADH dehydrogenase subunit 6 [Teliapsocus conterminus]
MLMSMMMASILFMTLFFSFKTPLSLGITLICQTLTLAFLMGSMMKSFWFMYLLVLIFIGGMLVLFIYVTSIFPNEKFEFKTMSFVNLMIFLLIMMVMMLSINFLFQMNNPMNSIFYLINISEDMLMYPSMKMFYSNVNFMLIFMVNYLFYCMVVVIKITNFFKGPLRKLN